MSISTQLSRQFQNLFSGQPWHGDHIYGLLAQVTFESAYTRPVAAGHTIIEILLHMLSWTVEVTARMNGKFAAMPASGNWSEAGAPDEQKWQQLVNDLKLANVNLQGIIAGFPVGQWAELINDIRGSEPVTTYEELIQGFMQHQIYHAGQIALLNRQING